MAWFQVSFFSECLKRSVPLNVLIPGDIPFAISVQPNTKPYKTLYLLHGYAGNYTDWLLYTQITEMSQAMNLAVVMPSGDNGFYVDQPGSGIRGSEFIGRELVEFTRTLFPLSHELGDTIIAGLSMGGYGSIYNALRYGDVFGHAISLSAPVIPIRASDIAADTPETLNAMGITHGYLKRIHGDLPKIMETDRNLALFAKQTLDAHKPIADLYIACGYNDMLVRENRELSENLKSINFPHVYEEGSGTHEWAFWNEFLRRGLTRIIPPVTMPNPFWVVNDREGGDLIWR